LLADNSFDTRNLRHRSFDNKVHCRPATKDNDTFRWTACFPNDIAGRTLQTNHTKTHQTEHIMRLFPLKTVVAVTFQFLCQHRFYPVKNQADLHLYEAETVSCCETPTYKNCTESTNEWFSSWLGHTHWKTRSDESPPGVLRSALEPSAQDKHRPAAQPVVSFELWTVFCILLSVGCILVNGILFIIL